MGAAEKIEAVKFAIAIPTINRWDLLRTFLSLYINDFPNTKIYVLDNGNQAQDVQSPNIIYLNEKKESVAASWNYLLFKIFETDVDFALTLNDDIYLGKSEYHIKNLLYYHGKTSALFRCPLDFSVFIMPRATFQVFGRFNEAFKPAYYEDADYMYRMKLGGLGVATWADLTPMHHRDNSSCDRDPALRERSKGNKKLYIEMWGGLPGEEKFLTPFSGKPKK